MRSKLLLGLSAASLAAAEDVLGVYIFHRHGDRTAKAWEPVNMTALGADQVYSSGTFYRDRYVSSDADMRVRGLSSDIAVLSQLTVTSPVDPVLHNSAVTYLQGLYPPTNMAETLANGSTVEAPLGGYQYIPVDDVDTAATAEKAESSAWLQGDSGCSNAEISSNQYFSSSDYADMLDKTQDFYSRLVPVVNGTMSEDEVTFKNAYSVFDLINVARIHNSSIPSEDLLDEETVDQLHSLASIHQWNLAYNSSDTVRAIAGSILGGQIVDALELIVQEPDAKHPPMNVQFGAYGTFMAFFGLAELPAADDDFYGITDYASSMAFELVTNATTPTADDISVRFLFANGTAGDKGLSEFPLFGQEETLLPWDKFKEGMMAFSVHDDEHWCEMCGVTGGRCPSRDNNDNSGPDDGDGQASADSTADGSDNGISKPVAGAIGALVTLVVILGVQAVVMLLGGLRLVKKSTLEKRQHRDMTLK